MSQHNDTPSSSAEGNRDASPQPVRDASLREKNSGKPVPPDSIRHRASGPKAPNEERGRSSYSGPERRCPNCGSKQIHRSRSRGSLEGALAMLGASICRCQACRLRHARFGRITIKVEHPGSSSGVGIELLVLALGLLGAIALGWWVFSR